MKPTDSIPVVQPIVVGVDGTEPSQSALVWAINQAKCTGGPRLKQTMCLDSMRYARRLDCHLDLAVTLCIPPAMLGHRMTDRVSFAPAAAL